MSWVSYGLCFETLSNELRLQILDQLRYDSLSVEQLAQSLNAERSRVSHALQMLLTCNYVSVQRKGKERIYSLHEKVREGAQLEGKSNVIQWMDAHIAHVCGNDCPKAKLLEAKSR